MDAVFVPAGDDQNVYIVVDDFGRSGRAYRETDIDTADLKTTIADLMAGEVVNTIRVVAFNTAERWSEDVSEGVARDPAPVRPASGRRAVYDSGLCRTA